MWPVVTSYYFGLQIRLKNAFNLLKKYAHSIKYMYLHDLNVLKVKSTVHIW